MKTISKGLLIAVICSGFFVFATAQQRSGKLEVSTRLKEAKGTYDQRKLYREFLVSYMNNCPYITHFSVHEALGSSDNHEVVWRYEVNSWEDITQFYDWIKKHLQAKKDDGLKKAMTPYQPDYAIGGKINVEKRSKAALARD